MPGGEDVPVLDHPPSQLQLLGLKPIAVGSYVPIQGPYIHICMYICICEYVYICKYVYVYLYICMYFRYVPIYVCICLHVYMCICFMYMCLYAYMYMYRGREIGCCYCCYSSCLPVAVVIALLRLLLTAIAHAVSTCLLCLLSSWSCLVCGAAIETMIFVLTNIATMVVVSTIALARAISKTFILPCIFNIIVLPLFVLCFLRVINESYHCCYHPHDS